MASWNELLDELEKQPTTEQARTGWLSKIQNDALRKISEKRGNRNIIFYASGFLQKPQAPPMWLQLTHEEINGFMSVMYGMDWNRGLTLILHTPGGVTNAVETIVEYLNSKFDRIEVIIPTFAMSAGTMISLASDLIIMGRQSQLGPIDPQIPWGGRTISAWAIVDQFERGKREITGNLQLAHAWAPILQSLGPALLQEAQNALDYSESIVARWLTERMFREHEKRNDIAKSIAAHFNARKHLSHGKRINRDEAKTQGLIVEDLETDQDFQDAVLTAYHSLTLVFEKTPATKLLISDQGRMWVKNFNP